MSKVTKEQIANLLKIQSPNGLPKSWLENEEIVQALTGEKPKAEQLVVEQASDKKSVKQSLPIDLASLEKQASSCTKCRLHLERKNVVFGQGNLNPRLVFVGESPGENEDLKGEPFVGKAGQLLTAAIEKGLKLQRSDVYLCDIIKCKTPNNRAPQADEIRSCSGYLENQLKFLKPEVIVALGGPAMKALCELDEGITNVRGSWFKWNDFDVMPTFHPAYILRNPDAKKDFWNDLKLVMSKLGLE